MTLVPRASLALLLCLIAAVPAHGQPPRDAQQVPAKGTGVISGVLLSDDAQPKPLRRARITLTSPAQRVPLTAITHDNGTFRFDQLPAGSYTLRAVKDAYVTVSFGSVRPGRPGTPIVLGDGESRQVSLRMPRGGVITGVVTGPDGEPASGISITALVHRFHPAFGERRLTPAGAGPFGAVLSATAGTDDRGSYRLFGLPPGDYIVSADIRAAPSGGFRTLTEAEIRRALADVREKAPQRQPGAAASSQPAAAALEPQRTSTFSPVFFPGTTIAGQATAITIGAGEERTGIDIPLQYVPMARVDGSVLSPRADAPGANVILQPSQPAPEAGARHITSTNPDGTFTFRAVPPGTYVAIAQSMVRPSAPGAPARLLTGSTEISVNGEDIGNVALMLTPGVTLAGRIVFDGAPPPAVDFTKLKVPIPLVSTVGGVPAVIRPLQIDAEGRFTIEGVMPGVFRTSIAPQGVRTPIGGWWLKSIAIDGREVLDRPLEIRQASDNVVVTLSRRASTLSGHVRDAQGLPVPGVAVVAFGADPASWFANSPRIAGVRAGADGAYSIRNLPAGEYFIIATHDVEEGEWFDPALLKRLAPGAQRIALGQDEQKTHDAVIR